MPLDPYAPPQAALVRADQEAPDLVQLKRNELRELVWKIVALFLAVKAFAMIGELAMYVANGYQRAWWYVVPILGSAGGAVFAYAISRRITRVVREEELVEIDGRSAITLQRVAFSVIGVYLLAINAPAFFIGSVEVFNQFTNDRDLSWEALVNLATPTLACVIGSVLFFGAGALSRIWLGIRRYGTDDRRPAAVLPPPAP